MFKMEFEARKHLHASAQHVHWLWLRTTVHWATCLCRTFSAWFLCVASRCMSGRQLLNKTPFSHVVVASVAVLLFKRTQVGSAAWRTSVPLKHIKSLLPSCVWVEDFLTCVCEETGWARASRAQCAPQGHPEVDQSRVSVCEPGNRIRVSRLMGTLLSYIRQYVCTEEERAHHSGPRCFILLCRWITADTGIIACCETSDRSAWLIEQVSKIYIMIFQAGLNFSCSHREADDWFDYLIASLTYERGPFGPLRLFQIAFIVPPVHYLISHSKIIFSNQLFCESF